MVTFFSASCLRHSLVFFTNLLFVSALGICLLQVSYTALLLQVSYTALLLQVSYTAFLLQVSYTALLLQVKSVT